MQWMKSPQYANMPHEQYMQTDEGRRSTQAFTQWDNWLNARGGGKQASPGGWQKYTPAPRQPSGGFDPFGPGGFGNDVLEAPEGAFKPGAAQPIASQSKGTPYSPSSPSPWGAPPQSAGGFRPQPFPSPSAGSQQPKPSFGGFPAAGGNMQQPQSYRPQGNQFGNARVMSKSAWQSMYPGVPHRAPSAPPRGFMY